MAWRIAEHVLRGEIDNATRGRVTGRLWLAGIDQPLVLDLGGDCHPDLAGCLLKFENPVPLPMTTKPPAFAQRGTAGDITAARKVRVFDVPIAEAYPMLKAGGKPPEHLANCLYVEWFSELSGRVVIESTDFRLDISAPVWRFTAEELAERQRLAAEQGRDSLAISADADGNAREWDEFRCEQALRESDALAEKYGRLLEKYGDHPDSERLIAREMGWTWLEDVLDADEARGPSEDPAAEGPAESEAEVAWLEPEPDPAREGIDWVRDGEDRIIHPIQKRAKDALYTLLDELKAGGLYPECEDEALGDFVGHFMNVSAKLAGALGGVARGDDLAEPGMVIAQLKRILEILHQTLTAADALAGKPFLTTDRLTQHRAALFAVREDILALITQLRGKVETISATFHFWVAEKHTGAAGKTREEMDAIAQQLASAIGLGARDLKTSSDAERAHCAVAKRIKQAIQRDRPSNPRPRPSPHRPDQDRQLLLPTPRTRIARWRGSSDSSTFHEL